MLKTHELRDIISGYLSDHKSEEWDSLLQVEYEYESNNILHVNFIENDESGILNNKYKITIEAE